MLFISLLVILVDQALKVVLFDVATLNSGVAFGLASQYGSFSVAMLSFGLVGSVYLYRTTSRDRVNQILWSLILGGVVSNLIDRIRIGAVIDPLAISQLHLCFNLADVAVSVGFFLLCLRLLGRGLKRELN
jgi:signal peptidase II